MTEAIRAAILGIVQGLTEFLPVSSSGHLEIAKYVLQDNSVAEQSLLMTVVLHFATALSTVVVFRRQVLDLAIGLFKFKNNEELIFSLKILVSMIPAVFVGLVFEDQIEALFDKQLLLVGFMLIVSGILLIFADRAKRTGKNLSYIDAFTVGVAQAIAILPGISRSGATISTSVMLGIDREKAAQFSFLMVVPLIFGKIAKDLISGDDVFTAASMMPLSIGFCAAFVTGLFACTWMIQLVKAAKLTYFSVYCFIVAALAIAKALNVF